VSVTCQLQNIFCNVFYNITSSSSLETPVVMTLSKTQQFWNVLFSIIIRLSCISPICRLPQGWDKHSNGPDTGVHDDGLITFMQNVQDTRPNIGLSVVAYAKHHWHPNLWFVVPLSTRSGRLAFSGSNYSTTRCMPEMPQQMPNDTHLMIWKFLTKITCMSNLCKKICAVTFKSHMTKTWKLKHESCRA